MWKAVIDEISKVDQAGCVQVHYTITSEDGLYVFSNLITYGTPAQIKQAIIDKVQLIKDQVLLADQELKIGEIIEV